MYPNIERLERKLIFFGESSLSDFQWAELRRKTSDAFKADGNRVAAKQVRRPDQISYVVNGSGAGGNMVWILVFSFVFLVISYPFRLQIFYCRKADRRRRAILMNRCPNCGYDTRMLPQPRCPECGEVWEECDEELVYLTEYYSSVSRTLMNASCGMETLPTVFIRFFPAFCFSRSFRFRVTSPP